MEYTRPLGRADFIGGIDNEALDFGQLEFIQGTVNGANNLSNLHGAPAGNLNPLSVAISSNASTAGNVPIGSLLTANASPLSKNHGLENAPSQLPDSPPDSGSEPPYSPADINSVQHLGQLSSYHLIHKQEDVLLSSTIVPSMPPGALSNSNVQFHPSEATILDMGQQSIHHRGYRNENDIGMILNRPPQTTLLVASDRTDNLNNVDLNCLMNDVMFHHQQLAVPSPPTHSSNTHSFRSQIINAGQTTPNGTDIHIAAPSRKRRASQQLNIIPECVDTVGNLQPNSQDIKRSPPVTPISIIKPEPGTLSPPCPTIRIEPTSPSASMISESCTSTGNTISGTETQQTSLIMEGGSSNSALSGSTESIKQQNSDSNCGDNCPMQCIRFAPFQQQNWHTLCDQSLKELPPPHYRVDADKGFNFSNSDDAFVCQKKNHFQVTCHAQLQGAPAIFVRTGTGLEKIKSFHLHFYGVKSETPTQTIRVEQSQSDRSKKPFHPVPIDLQNRQVSKVTVGRLHFSETTSNNMRKKGRPNPEQRYFQLVVGLHAHTHSGHFPIISHGSERIIVRASNPGQFESDVELCWQRGVTQDSIFHSGCVGINTDRPDESLVVHGNLKISGHIVQPSDSRAKQEISELDTSQQLQNVRKIRVVKYRYEPEFAMHSGLNKLTNINSNGGINSMPPGGNHIIDTGVIAQEVREVLPDAVQEAGSVLLPNGDVIDNFLLVNKDRIYMENIGAVKELCKVTGSLEMRIEQLERINSRLINIQKIGRQELDCTHSNCKLNRNHEDGLEPCTNKMIQVIIVFLIFIMAICLAAISTLYFVEHNKHNYYTGSSHLFPHANDNFKTGFGQGVYDMTNGRNGNQNGRFHNRKPEISSDNNRVISIPDSHQNRTNNRSLPQKKLMEDINEPNDSADIYESFPSAPGDPNYVDKEHKYQQQTLELSNGRHSKVQRTPMMGKQIVGDLLSISSKDQQHNSKSIDSKNPIASDQNDRKHEITDTSYLLTDVDTNLIDIGQTGIRDDNKTDSNILKNIGDEDFQHLLGINNQIIFESEYQRERTIDPPIGTPTHCLGLVQVFPATQTEQNASALSSIELINSHQSNFQELTMQCPSFCNVRASSPVSIEQPEPVFDAIIPENVEISDSNATTAPFNGNIDEQKRSSSIENHTNSTENTKHNSTANTSTDATIHVAYNLNESKISIGDNNDETPVEIRDLPAPIEQIKDPSIPTVSALPANHDIHATSSFVALVEPVASNTEHIHLPDDSFLIQTQKNRTEMLDNVWHSDDTNSKTTDQFNNSNGKQISAVPVQTTVVLNNVAAAATVEAEDSTCLIVQVILRTVSFNTTLGSDYMCPQSNNGLHSFNITYNVPLSKYMKEKQFELIFVTKNPFNWRLCSTKQRTGKDRHVQIDYYNMTEDAFPKGVATTTFEVNIPQSGYFDRQMEFKTSLVPNDMNACRVHSASISGASPIQFILYKINFSRDCI